MGRLPGGIDHYSCNHSSEEHKPDQHADQCCPAAALTHRQPLQTGPGVESLG